MGETGSTIFDHANKTARLRKGFTRCKPTVCRRKCRTGYTAEAEMPPRKQMALGQGHGVLVYRVGKEMRLPE